MRYIEKLLVGSCLLALFVGVAVAGLNPANPGLPTSYGIANNGKSVMCMDCHTVTPASGTHKASHFVWAPNVSALGSRTATTHSGGGWSSVNSKGARTGRQYFRINMWLGGGSGHAGTWSKYGGATTGETLGTADNSYCTAAATDNAGVCITDTTAGNYSNRQIICESCHNIIKNVAGGNNLVAPMTSDTYLAQYGNATQVNPWSSSIEATLCVGCHGFMFTTNAANTEARYADARSDVDGATGTKRDNNHMHYMYGIASNQNHHVGTLDGISTAKAAAGLLWRDVNTVPQDMDGVTVDTGSSRGQMPMLATWNTDGGKIKASTGSPESRFNCLHCHAQPHTGDITTGASILRDTNAAGDATDPIQRLGEGSTPRAWMRIADIYYCNDCHKTK